MDEIDSDIIAIHICNDTTVAFMQSPYIDRIRCDVMESDTEYNIYVTIPSGLIDMLVDKFSMEFARQFFDELAHRVAIYR